MHLAPTETPEPPFRGTIFIDPDILVSSDHSTLTGLTSGGRGFRTMFDRRVNGWVTLDAYLFSASFEDGLATELQVNPEFGDIDAATEEAARYAEMVGRLPRVLRAEVDAVWIHRGVQPFGGGYNSLLIHTDQASLYADAGILEETLAHEAAHTSLDQIHATSSGWAAAQKADRTFISTYAREHPAREDVAETFVAYLAVRYRSHRISPELAQTIRQTIPNRLEYFDRLGLAMHPVE